MAENLKDYAPYQQMMDIDIKEVLKDKGITFVDKGEWIHMRCLFPDHNDSDPSMSINTEHYAFNCFGCGRQGTWAEMCEELGWDIGSKGDSVLVGVTPNTIWEESKQKMKGKDLKNEKVFHLPEGFRLISDWDRCYKYLKQRNIESAISIFNIGRTSETDSEYGENYKNRVIIPVHNSEGKYIWPEGRLIFKSKKKKYFRPFNVKKHEYLFNYHRSKKQFDWVIVVEGIIDAVNLWLWGYPAVCTFGAGMGMTQLELLMKFQAIYLCYDNDNAGISALIGDEKKTGIKDLVLGTGVDVYRILMPRRLDVNDIEKKYFDRLLDKAQKL